MFERLKERRLGHGETSEEGLGVDEEKMLLEGLDTLGLQRLERQLVCREQELRARVKDLEGDMKLLLEANDGAGYMILRREATANERVIGKLAANRGKVQAKLQMRGFTTSTSRSNY
mmetsp:Transcript_7513/g.15290  ORF Transcript_7513/g.15290 Transcript_7513/m.15290 type:complete len:117 (-) Transcript_7513:1214-1564(-)